MPIAKLRPDSSTPAPLNLPQTQSNKYHSTIVNDAYQPVESLLVYVEGSAWTVEYYSQVLSKHNDLKDFDPTQTEIYQSYNKIHKLELRVTAPLSSSYMNDTGISQVQGSAYLPTCIVPNVGDVFIAGIDTGESALFRISLVERKTYNRAAVYYVEYSLYGLIAQHPDWIARLDQKVQREYYYNKDRLADGLDALVTPQHQQLLLDTQFQLDYITKYYFKTFFNQNYSTLVLPNQEYAFYDPLVVKFVLKLVNTQTSPHIVHINNLSVEDDVYLSQPTIWDALLDRDYSQLEYINRQMGWVSSRAFFQRQTVNTVRYQRMHYIIYPIDLDDSVSLDIDPLPKTTIATDVLATPAHHNITDMLYNEYVYENTTIPILPALFQDSYYLVSPDFYQTNSTVSLIESLMRQYLKQESLDLEKLLIVLNNYSKWNRLEQFYYTPVMMAMMKTSLGTIQP